jgi:hypothetical protein
MSSRFALLLTLLAAPLSEAGTARRAWVVRWDAPSSSPETRALAAEIDAGLRDVLRRRGAQVLEAPSGDAIVLRPTVTVESSGVRLSMIGVSSTTRQVLGSISLRAAGPRRPALVRALVTRACDEAQAFDAP